VLNVSSWSIRNPIPAVMLFVLLTVAGFIAFGSMKVQNFPDLDLPTITVNASLPGVFVVVQEHAQIKVFSLCFVCMLSYI